MQIEYMCRVMEIDEDEYQASDIGHTATTWMKWLKR